MVFSAQIDTFSSVNRAQNQMKIKSNIFFYLFICYKFICCDWWSQKVSGKVCEAPQTPKTTKICAGFLIFLYNRDLYTNGYRLPDFIYDCLDLFWQCQMDQRHARGKKRVAAGVGGKNCRGATPAAFSHRIQILRDYTFICIRIYKKVFTSYGEIVILVEVCKYFWKFVGRKILIFVRLKNRFLWCKFWFSGPIFSKIFCMPPLKLRFLHS